jgi:hypothetical protein
LYPANFGCLGGNWSFSTATPVFANQGVVWRDLLIWQMLDDVF